MHLALDGDAPLPWEHYIGRLSEEFGGALPSAILAEVARLPVGFMEQIIEYRHYAAAKGQYDATTTPEARRALRQSPMGALAEVITFDLVEESISG